MRYESESNRTFTFKMSDQVEEVDLAVEAKENAQNEPEVNGIDPIDEARHNEIRKEILEIEEEVKTLKQALQRKEKRLHELRTEIGETRWAQMRTTASQKYQTIQNSNAVKKGKESAAAAAARLSEASKNLGSATAQKWSSVKESQRYQTMSEKLWSATAAAKKLTFTGYYVARQSITAGPNNSL